MSATYLDALGPEKEYRIIDAILHRRMYWAKPLKRKLKVGF
jgi:hypothetical protein